MTQYTCRIKQIKSFNRWLLVLAQMEIIKVGHVNDITDTQLWRSLLPTKQPLDYFDSTVAVLFSGGNSKSRLTSIEQIERS